MNFIKSCLLITMFLGIGYSQCDANGDGDLNVQDVVIEVNCILSDCWEVEPSICDGLTEVELWGETYAEESRGWYVDYKTCTFIVNRFSRFRKILV